MKTLFIGSHCDEELCFAGALQALTERIDGTSKDGIKFFYGDRPDVLFFSSCRRAQLVEENKESMQILDISGLTVKDYSAHYFEPNRQNIANYLYSIRDNYDTVFTHSTDDRHLDHRVVAEESLRVFNCSLFTYVGPWNSTENADYFVELTEQQLEKKIQAMACYKSQAHRPYMCPDFIRSWARYNGIKCGKLYAEGFKVVRLVQNL